jgi:alkylation response protein AidB-like acyl-CoA dehydrogenase
MIATQNRASIKGGEFLIKETEASQVFIPEEFTEEQQMIAQSCRDFLMAEVWPRLDEIDQAKSPALMSSLMDKAGALGLLGTAVPEEYGGFGMNFNTSMLVAEATGAGNSFSVALSAHTGIGPSCITATTTSKAVICPNWLRASGKLLIASPNLIRVQMPIRPKPKPH